MIRFFRYDLNSEFDTNKESLNQLDNYVALTEDNKTIHYKPLQNIFYVTTNNTNTTIYKRIDNQNKKETVTLKNGENKLIDWNYGFYFDGNMSQSQITSFDLSKFNTSNVSYMNYMFYQCSGLTSLDLSNFDTSNVTNMNYMFSSCKTLTSLDLSNFNTSKVTSMYGMFSSCSGLTSLDLSNFNTSMVTTMREMFQKCSGLTYLNLTNFDTSNVTNMNNIFSNCNKLTHIKCKQAFKDWCWTNQDTIGLPTEMRDGGEGKWEIID